jgi:hypothetical protein
VSGGATGGRKGLSRRTFRLDARAMDREPGAARR